MRNYSIRKRVLVTGGAGFIGSHLCDRLIADGHNIMCVVSKFIVQVLCGKPKTIAGDGKQTRSFFYVIDMIEHN